MDWEEGKKYEKKDFRKLYEDLVKSDWFKKAYNNKSLGECPLDFPELRESEDERIRKEAISIVQSYMNICDEEGDPCLSGYNVLAYLEKQKEQKTDIELIQRSWYMEGYHDREFDKEPKWIIKTGEGGPKHELNPRYGQPLAEQKPAEWSGEDKQMLEEIINHIHTTSVQRIPARLGSDIGKSWIKFLKSLRPDSYKNCNSRWKPSEEQMSMLLAVINEPNNAGAESCQMALKSLYEDLKKL